MAPAGRWKHFQRHRSTEEDIRRWYGPHTGIGIVCGEVSGHLEMLEFEGRAVAEGVWQDFNDLADQTGLRDLVDRIKHGYGERTPSGGHHLLYRCPDGVEGSDKLAKRPRTGEEAADDELAGVKGPNPRVLIETRGQGGYAIVAPSGGRVHPTGLEYRLVYGGFDSIVTITAAERAALHEMARSLDRMPRVAVEPSVDARGSAGRPGDDFASRTTWAEILEPHGWRPLFIAGDGNQHWRRPGKDRGTSATVNERGEGVLYVFSTSTTFDAERAYSKFAAYTVLNHGGDFAAAARTLRAQGYGQSAAEAEPELDETSLDVVVCTDRGLCDRDGQPGMADDALRALIAANEETLSVFERGRRLVRVGHTKAGPDGSGHPVIETLGKAAFAGLLAPAAWFVTIGGRDRTPKKVTPPPGIVEEILERGTWHGIPSLSGVVETPVVRPDGSILSSPATTGAPGSSTLRAPALSCRRSSTRRAPPTSDRRSSCSTRRSATSRSRTEPRVPMPMRCCSRPSSATPSVTRSSPWPSSMRQHRAPARACCST